MLGQGRQMGRRQKGKQLSRPQETPGVCKDTTSLTETEPDRCKAFLTHGTRVPFFFFFH